MDVSEYCHGVRVGRGEAFPSETNWNQGGQRAGFATDLDKVLLVWETFRLVRVKNCGLIQIGWDDGAWFDLGFGGGVGSWWLPKVLPGCVDEEGTLDGGVNLIAPHHFQTAFSACKPVDADD